MTTDAEYGANQIAEKLVGAKIIGAATDDSKEYFCMIVQKGKKKYNVWIDGDEEGNGCGAIKIDGNKSLEKKI